MLYMRNVYAVFQPPTGIQVMLAKDLVIVPNEQFFGDVKSGMAGPDIPVQMVQPVFCLQINASPVQFVQFLNRELTSSLVGGMDFVLANQLAQGDANTPSPKMDLQARLPRIYLVLLIMSSQDIVQIFGKVLVKKGEYIFVSPFCWATMSKPCNWM